MRGGARNRIGVRLAAAVAVLAAGAEAGRAGSPAPEAVRMSPADVAAFAEGRTLIYRDADGVALGAERHVDARRVVWSDPAGACTEGVWRAAGPQMCFTYADAPLEELCWQIRRRADGLIEAVLQDQPVAMTLSVEVTDAPLTCAMPDAGV